MELRQLKWAVVYILGFMFIGTLGFLFFEEKFTLLDAVWLTETTLLTIGYGDRLPTTATGQIFNLMIMPLGVGIMAYAIGIIAGSVVEGRLKYLLGRRAMETKISKLNNHVIVCGAGRVGFQVAQQLAREGMPFVVIDVDDEATRRIEQEKMLYILGDASEDDVLRMAGIERARGLIAALPTDADNVFISLTAKGIKPDLMIVARADRVESEDKLRRAGADKIVSPAVIGGKRMAVSILKPVSVEYVDTVIHNKDFEIELEEISINEQSPLVGKTLAEARIREDTGALIVAIRRGSGLISNPQANEFLVADDLLITFGTRSQLIAFERLAMQPKK